jgi:hypothetical protein
MNRLVVVLCFVTCSISCSSQILDTIRELFKSKYSIDARLESRNSFINHQLIGVSGARLGVTFQRKFRIGLGLSWLDTDVKSNYFSINDFGKTDTLTRYLKFVYLCYYVDFVFYKTKRWQLSVPIQTGTGLSWFQQKSNYTLKGKAPKYFLLLYEPGITVQFKVFKWFGFGTDVAYRFTLNGNTETRRQLNSPTYSFKILVWFDQLFYDLAPESIFTKKFGPSYW